MSNPRNSSTQKARAHRNRRMVLVGGVVTVMLLITSACGASDNGGGDASENELVIGVPAPLTGAGAAFGTPAVDAMKFTVEQINADGGIEELGGVKIRLEVVDTKSDPVLAGQILRQMAADNVSALSGPMLSAEAVANVPLLQRLKIPSFSPWLDDRVTDNNAGYVFRMNDRAAAWGEQAIAYIEETEAGAGTTIERVGSVSIDVPPGTSTDVAITQGAQQNGWDLTSIPYDQVTTKDFAPIIAKLEEADVQVVTGYQNPNDAILFAKALQAQSWRPEYGFVWVAGGQYLSSFKKELGDDVNGWMDVSYTGDLSNENFSPEIREIASKYEEKYEEPLVGYSAAAVSVIGVIAEAAAKAESTDPEDIAEAARALDLESADDFTYPYFSLLGGLSFDENQDNVAWVAPVVQLTGDLEQTVIFPASVATGEAKPQ